MAGLSSYAWIAEETPQGRVYRRPMGLAELGFFWDGEFTGTADGIQHCIVDVLSDVDIFCQENVERAWISLKQRFPLLGGRSYLPNEDPAKNAYILVSEAHLSQVHPGELVFLNITSAREADEMVDKMMNGPRILSRDMQACAHILKRIDTPNVYHLMLQSSHLVTDATANTTFLRNFLDLVSAVGKNTYVPSLEARLAPAIPWEELRSERDYNHPRTRWRRAIGMVLAEVKASNMTGGHTLPCTVMDSTAWTASRSTFIFEEFSPARSTRIFEICRKNSITLGNALTVLGQVALLRVLYRRYLTGEISEEEWGHRKRQPMHTGGPINLRPYMRRDWYENGGGGDIMLCVGFLPISLPLVPLPDSNDVQLDAPSFDSLLPRRGFLHRCGLVKSALRKHLKHPLFAETAARTSELERSRLTALLWKKAVNGESITDEDRAAAAKVAFGNSATDPPVFSFGGSSIGSVDTMLPSDYPLPSAHSLSPLNPLPLPLNAGRILDPPHPLPEDVMHPTPVIHLRSMTINLRCRPGELYLGARTFKGSLTFFLFYDRNVFASNVVKEWMKEVRAATNWYLCSDEIHVNDYNDNFIQLRPRL